MTLRRSLVVLFGIALVALAAAIALKTRGAVPAQQVAAAKPTPDPELSLQATLQAAATVQVGVPLGGRIESFQVEVGDEVYQGQLLAQIRSQGLETAKLEAETDLENAATRLRNLEASLSAAKLEASRASADSTRVRNDLQRADKNFQREKMLLAEGATPRRVYEKAEKDYAALQVESSNLDAVATAAEERVSSMQQELDGARKLLEHKTADLEEADHRIGSGEITSPVNGVVVARRGVAGDDVQPTMTDLFQIASDLSVMLAVADASPSQTGRLPLGHPATISVVEMGGEMIQGAVAKLENGRITVEFQNPNALIRPGLTAQIRIKLP